jgi:hypothetical protein
MLQRCCHNSFQSLNLFLPFFLSFFHLFPSSLFQAFLLYHSFFFVSTPFLMFVFPLGSQLFFFEYVCVQIQGVSWHSFYKSMCLGSMHFSKKMTSMPPLPTFIRSLFVHVYASSLADTCLWMPKMPSPKPIDVPLWCSLIDGPHPQCSFTIS